MPITAPHPAQDYWDRVAEEYDRVFPETLIGKAQRAAVWREFDRTFLTGQHLLELNCGTGIDAVHLATKGIRVTGCDVSPRMVKIANERAASTNLQEMVDFRILAIENLASLNRKHVFDGVFSNFSGLNCVQDHSAVARDLAPLLKPGAPAVFCIVGRVVSWEIIWHLAHGNFRAAVRSRGTKRFPESPNLVARCPSVAEMKHAFEPQFRLMRWRGIGVAVPPIYYEPVARRFPRVLRALAAVDSWISAVPGIRGFGDCLLLQFERSSVA